MRRLLLVVVGISLVTAACSSGSAGDEVASLTATATDDIVDPVVDEEVDRETALLAFTQCLRDEGMEVDDPEVGADGQLRMPRPAEDGDRDAMQAAREACSGFLEGVTLGFEQRNTTEFQDMLLEYASCMRENGYEMADPDLSGFQPGSGQGGGGGIFGGLEDRDDPVFLAADEVCRDIFGESGFRPGGGGGPGGGGVAP
ncbi:MAG: hypothetical protein P1T08_07430 [Acidimicrobiia bacterium]|nr:hypothetical protein [Acidimicrobiia bacterium]